MKRRAKRKPAAKASPEQLAPQAQPSDPGNTAHPIWLPRVAGVRVTEETALTYAAFWACVRVISDALAVLPMHAYRKRPGGGRDEATDNVVDWLCHTQTNPETPAFFFRQTILAHALVWGNGYAEIERDAAGRVVWLWQLTPDRVEPDRNDAGDLVYIVANPDRTRTVLPAEDVIHLRGLGFDGLVGYSVVRMAARAIGIGIAGDEAVTSFYANDSTPGGYLKHPQRLQEQAKKNLQESFYRKHGGPDKRRTMAILEEGMEWVQVGMPPEDAQLLQTRQFAPVDICRIFKVPPHKIGDLSRATFSNIEQQETEFVVDCLMPWAVPLEQEINSKLFGIKQKGSLFVKHNFNGRLRGDSAARAAFYGQLFDRGVFSVNDICEMEDRNPVGPEGDKRFVPLNMQLLERAGEEPLPGEDPPADDPAPKADPATQAPPAGVRGAALAVIADAAHRCVRREVHRAEDALKRLREDQGKLDTWAAEFLEDQLAYVLEAITPGVELLAALLDRSDLTDQLAAVALSVWRTDLATRLKSLGRGEVLDAWSNGHHWWFADTIADKAAALSASTPLESPA